MGKTKKKAIASFQEEAISQKRLMVKSWNLAQINRKVANNMGFFSTLRPKTNTFRWKYEKRCCKFSSYRVTIFFSAILLGHDLFFLNFSTGSWNISRSFSGSWNFWGQLYGSWNLLDQFTGSWNFSATLENPDRPGGTSINVHSLIRNKLF